MQEQAKPATPPPPPKQGNGGRGGPQAPGIVFDSDMGRNIDAALALAVLYGLGPKGKVIAVGISNSNLQAAGYCDLLERFFAGDPVARTSGTSGVLPVGMAEDGPKVADSAMLKPIFNLKDAGGQPVFRHGINELIDTADVRLVFRNALLTQKPGEGKVVLAGPATNLVRTMAVNGGREALTKAGILVVAAGSYPEGAADPRIQADIPAARELFARWPTPIVAVGTEIAAAVPYPASSIETDYTWTPHHPVVEAYRAYHAAPFDAPSQAVVAALYAGEPEADYFRLSPPGTIAVLDDGRTRFTPSANGRHRYLMVDVAQRDRVVKAFVALASAKPAPPSGGRGPRVQQAPVAKDK